MLKVIVKTLDSLTREFEVPDSTTIKDFKEKIASTVEVPSSQQRLIYQGRVLNDDYVLNQAQNGMTLHLVTRAANSSTPVATSPSSPASNTTTQSSPPNADPFNSGQLGQVIFQQAMSGLEVLLGGGIQNVPMSMNQSSGNRSSMEPPINVHVSVSPLTTTVGSAGTSSHGSASRTNQSNVCVPRQELLYVERLLTELNTSLDQLEQENAESSSSKQQESRGRSRGSSPAHANQPNINPQSRTDSEMSSSRSPERTSPFPNCTNHPPLNDFASCNSRLLQAQHRLEPFMLRYIDFLTRDPSFQSTQSVEFTSTAHLLRSTLHCQSLMSEIQGVLSNIVIPLDRTPPRAVSIRSGSEPRSSHGSPSRRSGHAPDAPTFSRPIQIQVPILENPIAQQVFPPNQGARTRVRHPAPGTSPTAAANAPPQAAARGSNVGNPPPPTASQTPVPGQPYSIVIDTLIQPRVEICVGSETEARNQFQPPPANSPCDYTNQQTSSNPTSTGSSLPFIPGINPEIFQNVFQTVANSFLNATNRGSRQQPATVVVSGPPGGPNQIVGDLSSIISQAVDSSVSAQAAAAQNQQPPAFESTPSAAAPPRSSQSTTQAAAPPRSSAPTPPAPTPPRLSAPTPPAPTPPRPSAPTPPAPTPPRSSASTTAPQTTKAETTTPASSTGSLLLGGSFGRRAPSTRAPSSSGSGFFQNFEQSSNPIFQMFLSRPIGDFFQNFGLEIERPVEDILSRVTHVLANRLSMSDIVGAGQGRPIPLPKLSRLRNEIRRLLLTECFNGTAPDQQRIVEYARSYSEENRETLVELVSAVNARPGVDLVQSNILLLTEFVTTCLNILFFEDDARFFDSMYTHIRHFLSLSVAVNEFILQGGRRELADVLERFIANSQYKDALTALVQVSHMHQDRQGHPYESYIQSLASLHPVGGQEELERFVSRKKNPKPASQVQEPHASVSDVLCDRSRELSQDQTKSSEASRVEKKGSNTEKETKNTSHPASTSNAGNPTDNADVTWQDTVPPDWVPIITDDINRQMQDESQPPLSNAYKAGTKGKAPQKRK